ncbi:hypothetical protein SDC9_151284 [bioreactor metagenome]|uniref:Uncharacterized protein n=1 Tax=bioreactor metagenome TaxID=1076179 RepID=A0A645EPV6_9ZZZZ
MAVLRRDGFQFGQRGRLGRTDEEHEFPVTVKHRPQRGAFGQGAVVRRNHAFACQIQVRRRIHHHTLGWNCRYFFYSHDGPHIAWRVTEAARSLHHVSSRTFPHPVLLACQLKQILVAVSIKGKPHIRAVFHAIKQNHLLSDAILDPKR